MVCVIVASMPEQDLFIPDGAFLIAADKGYAHLKALSIEPDLTVGDFDSLGFVPNEEKLLHHPVEKDDTDMLLAVREGLRRGADTFILYGGLGGRLDHTLANLQTLKFIADNGAKGLLFGDGTAVEVLQDAEQCFPETMEGTVSVFCFGDKATGVTETGLYYAVRDAEITNAFPIGVSNHFTGQESRIQVKKGTLLLLWNSTAKEAFGIL